MHTSLYLILLALLSGIGVGSVVYGLLTPPLYLQRAQRATLLDGVQVKLSQARLSITAPQFLAQGALIGTILGLAGTYIVGSSAPLLPFFVGGYAVLWMRLQEQRNWTVTQYHHDLALAMGIIVNAWHARPTLSDAFGAVAAYGPGGQMVPDLPPEGGSVAADFAALLQARRMGTPLVTALQSVADRRRSPLFDGLAIALLVAEEQGAQAGHMLAEQAKLALRQVEAFKEALARQKSARSEILSGTLGPWLIALLLKVFTGSGLGGAEHLSLDFFHTPAGYAAVLAMAALTVGTYVWAMHLAMRGLLLTRVPTEYGKDRRQGADGNNDAG